MVSLFWEKWKMYILLGLSAVLSVLYLFSKIQNSKDSSKPMAKILIEQEKVVTDHVAESYKRANAGDELKLKEIDKKIEELENDRQNRDTAKTPSEISKAFRDLGY
jgi:low affinity Fe/Cu permease